MGSGKKGMLGVWGLCALHRSKIIQINAEGVQQKFSNKQAMVCLIFYIFYVVYDGTNYFMLLFVAEVTATTSKHIRI